MNIYMDMHTHTIASGHGYSTLQENIAQAKEVGLKYLGFSEHTPTLPGGPHLFFFQNFRCIPRKYGELTLFCGAEANIIDFDGNIDLPEDTLKRIDYCIASMHVPCVESGSAKENTRACIRAMKNPYVTILGHPDDARYPLDYEELVLAAKEEKVALEVNNSSLQKGSARVGAAENIRTMLQYCKEYEVEIILGSDSHFCQSIGDFQDAIELLEEISFKEELVLNTQPEYIKKVVRNYN
ncbi:phosphatase [Lachnospiraceae bacterium OttesenSCG-928-D06]|nr:phosphatase [Lachnospiraceae bacterium OttesenSCG-928-D06]